MSVQGPLSPSTAVNDPSFGSDSWLNPTNVLASDDTRATINNLDEGDASRYLKATDFGFTIPASATILGIEVGIEKHSTDAINDARLRLVKNDVIQTGDRASPAPWMATDTIKTYGGSADLWNTSWTFADLNSTNFGIAFAIESEEENADAEKRPAPEKMPVS